MVDAKHPEYTWYGEQPDAITSWFIYFSDKSTHKTLFYGTSNMKRSGTVFCNTHRPPNNTLYIVRRRKESNKSNNKKHSDSANLRIVWGVLNNLIRHETV